MVGLMSKEMYLFYTGQYYSSLDEEARGIMPFNAFQDRGNEPLSTLLSATANATALNFKLTDLVEAGVYDTLNQKPTAGGDRVAVVSTVHIAQTPYQEKNNWVDDKNKNPLPGEPEETDSKWKESEVVLVDKNFNTLVDPRDKQVVAEFGEYSDNRRLYVVNEIAIQAIGAGDMTVTFFSQDPTSMAMSKWASERGVSGTTLKWRSPPELGQLRLDLDSQPSKTLTMKKLPTATSNHLIWHSTTS